MLSVEPGGGHGYPIVLTCAEFSVYLTAHGLRPTFWVQLRADFIRTEDVRAAFDQAVAVIAQLSAGPLQGVNISRVDPFADVGGWSLSKKDSEGIVTSVTEVACYFVPRSEHLHSIRLGKKPHALRAYDKRYELQRKGGSADEFADLFWGGYRGPMTRVELEVWGERLREFGVRSFDDMLASLGDIWRYGTSRFAELRVPGSGPVESWPVSPAWQFVQQVGEWKFAHSGVVPLRMIAGDRTTILRTMRGYLTSFAAIEGVTSEREALWRLEESLPEVARGRKFEEDVVRKVARLPRGYRLRDAS